MRLLPPLVDVAFLQSTPATWGRESLLFSWKMYKTQR